MSEPGTRCDICKRRVPARYLDYDQWACEECRHRYWVRLELEG